MPFEDNPQDNDRSVSLSIQNNEWFMTFEGFEFPDDTVSTGFPSSMPVDGVLVQLKQQLIKNDVRYWFWPGKKE